MGSPIRRGGDAMPRSEIATAAPDLIATATVTVDTPGEGLFEITRDVAGFIEDAGAQDGALFLFMRHTSASLTIQENADPDVRTDLVPALRGLPPSDTPLVHATEGPHHMPPHLRTMHT